MTNKWKSKGNSQVTQTGGWATITKKGKSKGNSQVILTGGRATVTKREKILRKPIGNPERGAARR